MQLQQETVNQLVKLGSSSVSAHAAALDVCEAIYWAARAAAGYTEE